VQRCTSDFAFAENHIGIAFDQRLDLFQVAILGGVVNLAAEAEAAPSESDQQDGGTAGNWEMTGPASKRGRIRGFSDWLIANAFNAERQTEKV